MHVCTYIYCVHIYIYIQTNNCVYMYVCTYVRTYAFSFVRAYSLDSSLISSVMYPCMSSSVFELIVVSACIDMLTFLLHAYINVNGP